MSTNVFVLFCFVCLFFFRFFYMKKYRVKFWAVSSLWFSNLVLFFPIPILSPSLKKMVFGEVGFFVPCWLDRVTIFVFSSRVEGRKQLEDWKVKPATRTMWKPEGCKSYTQTHFKSVFEDSYKTRSTGCPLVQNTQPSQEGSKLNLPSVSELQNKAVVYDGIFKDL